MENRSMFVGLDVHKETIDVSIAEGHRNGEVRHYGVIASDLEPLDKVVGALRAPHRQLHFVYEAGPCVRHLPTSGQAWRGVRCRESVDGAQTKWRSREDRSAGQLDTGAAASCRRTAGDLCARRRG